MRKLTGMIAGAALTVGMGTVYAGETPEILGAADYQAMSSSQMSSITGERRIKIVNRNTNTNINFQQQAQCALLCAGGDLSILAPPPV